LQDWGLNTRRAVCPASQGDHRYLRYRRASLTAILEIAVEMVPGCGRTPTSRATASARRTGGHCSSWRATPTTAPSAAPDQEPAAVPGRPTAIATSLVGDGYARPGGVVRQPRQLDRHGGECVVDTRRQKLTERNTTELDFSRRANSENLKRLDSWLSFTPPKESSLLVRNARKGLDPDRNVWHMGVKFTALGDHGMADL
jgi:hypothetical protein